MYLLADAVVTVECSRAKTFDYAANLENFGDWFPRVVSIVASDELSAAAVGKRYSETLSVPLRGKRSVMIRVTDAMAPQRLVTEGDLRPVLPRMEMEFVDVGQNTCEVRWRMLSRNENRLAGCTVLPVAGWVMRRRAKIGLLNLKLLLEGGRRESAVPQRITSE
jgi:polyketide cyclase/dehydrase/lipid transport protein